METLAIIAATSYYVFAIIGVTLCVILFRHYRQYAWLLVSVAFGQPIWFLFWRVIHGRPLLYYITATTAPDGSIRQGYRIDFPIFFIVAIIGLYLLVRKTRHETSGLTSRRSQPPLALAVPLSRFTSRVGGGSASFVRRLCT